MFHLGHSNQTDMGKERSPCHTSSTHPVYRQGGLKAEQQSTAAWHSVFIHSERIVAAF